MKSGLYPQTKPLDDRPNVFVTVCLSGPIWVNGILFSKPWKLQKPSSFTSFQGRRSKKYRLQLFNKTGNEEFAENLS